MTDPHKHSDVREEYELELTPFDQVSDLDALILAVPHQFYKELDVEKLFSLFKVGEKFFLM